jgi:hypothetical protein
MLVNVVLVPWVTNVLLRAGVGNVMRNALDKIIQNEFSEKEHPSLCREKQ